MASRDNRPPAPPGQGPVRPSQPIAGPGEKPTPPGQSGSTPPGQANRPPSNTLPGGGRPPETEPEPERDRGRDQERENLREGDRDLEPIDLETKAKKNAEIQNNPDKQDPTKPIESQMMRVGASTPPIKDEYMPSPSPDNLVTATHDRDSVQPPDPTKSAWHGAPPMPLKEGKK